MSTSNDYKSKINNLKATIDSDNKKLQSLKRSGGSESDIENLKSSLKKNQAALNATTAEYNEYTQKAQTNESTGIGAITDSITNSVSNAVTNAVDKVTGGLVSKVNEVTNNVTNAVNKVTDTVNKVKNIKSELENKVSQIADKVVAAKDKLTNMVSGAKDAINNIFGSDEKKDKETTALASKKNDKGPKETQTKVETISPNEHSAMAQPLAFVTKKITTAVENTKSALVEQKKDDLPKKGPVADKIKQLGKNTGWTGAIKSITSDLKSGISKVTGFIKDVKNTVTNVTKSVVSTVKGAINSVTGIVSTVTSSVLSFTTPIVQGVSDVIKCGKDLTNEVTSCLPGPLASYVSSKTDAFFNKVTNKVTNSKLMQVQNILTKMNAVSESGNLADFVGVALLSQVNKKYPGLTDVAGFDLSHLYGDNTVSTVNEYTRLMKELCPQLSDLFPEGGIIDFSTNKTFFDSLLAGLAGSGAAGLLSQLANCEAANTLYYDEASVKTLQKSAEDALARGDIDTYKAIVERIGSNNIANPKLDLAVLSANMDKDKAASTGSTYCDLVTEFGYSPNDLCVNRELSDQVGATVYEGGKAALTTCSNVNLLTSAWNYGMGGNYSAANDVKLCQACYVASN
jgi:hypothetical protein